jgi:hypothetical protein
LLQEPQDAMENIQSFFSFVHHEGVWGSGVIVEMLERDGVGSQIYLKGKSPDAH